MFTRHHQRHVTVCLGVLLSLPVGSADAQPAGAQTARRGTCEYVKTATRVKRCYAGGVAKFTATISKGTTLWVEFDEPIVRFIPPERRYFARKKVSDRVITFRAKVDTWPDYTSAQIRTATMAITLDFSHGKAAAADVQLHIVRFDRKGRDAELERRVAAYTLRLDAAHKQKLKRLDAKARSLSRSVALRQLASGGAQIRTARGRRRVYQRHITIRTHERVRLGVERYARFTIKNEDASNLPIGAVRVGLARGGSVQWLSAARTRCKHRLLRPDRSTSCWLSLGLSRDLLADERVRIQVNEARGDRRATLKGVDLR